ncbi:MAG: hypothetical protein P4L40_14765 [Terracidiphilus sp.]|nr:hypothetical protein [Terracidiphilus sp.]
MKVNKGIVDKVLLVSKSRNQDEAGAAGAQKIVDDARAKYPDLVVQVPMCTAAYGCAFDEVMLDNNTVYVKMDDDIIFVKDGSIEHLVLAVLTNSDYSFYSGSVVNNPHSFAVHKFVGAMPVHSYHWKDMAPAAPPYVPPSSAGAVYYGKNMYDSAGSQAHESFIYNAAHGRLDVYGYDIWNQNQCR